MLMASLRNDNACGDRSGNEGGGCGDECSRKKKIE